MTFLSREDLLTQNKRRYQNVPLPTGGMMRIRNLSRAEMRKLSASLSDRRGEVVAERAEHLAELLICRCLVDGSGDPLFTDDDAMGGCLDEVDGAVIATLFDACKKWTGFSVDSDFRALEDAIKNSKNGQATLSGSEQPPA